MKKLVIGILVLLVGVPGFSLRFFDFFNLAAGVIPAGLIIAGLFAVYLGIGELRQPKDETAETEPDLPPEAPTAEDFKTQFLAGGVPQVYKTDKASTSAKSSPNVTSTKTNPDKKDADKKSVDTPSNAAAASESSQASEKRAPEILFKGNVETLVYHKIECNFATGKNCSMDFATKEEAESQGYKPCKICKDL